MIRSAGAYGAVMASSYNTRPLVPEVMVDGTRFAVSVQGLRSMRCSLRSGFRPGWRKPNAKGRDGRHRSHPDPRARRRAQDRLGVAALAWEGMWPRLMPLLAVIALFVAAAHLDLFGGLDPWVHTGVLAALARVLSGSAGGVPQLRLAGPCRGDPPRWSRISACRTGRWSLCRIASPPAARSDGDGLVGSPSPPRGGPAAGLGNKAAHPGLARFDTWALRLVPVLALIVADRLGRRLAHRPHGCRLHAGFPAAAAGRRQSVDRAAGLYRQAADLSRHGRPREAPARPGRQQARGLRRRRARPPCRPSW